MSDDTVVLQEEIKLVGSQKAVQALEAVGRAASKIGERFSELGRLAGSVAGIAGIFEIGKSVSEADDLFKAVSRISGATGMAANNAFGMLEAFKLNGIELEGGERIMLSLARNASKMTDSMFEGAAQGQKLAGIMAQMHVKADAGPEERLMAMSKAAQQGKLGINDMIQAFNIPRSQAMGMMNMLKKGPEALQEIQRKAMGSAGAIDDKALESFRKMQQARRELSEAWDNIVRVLYKSVMPLVTSVLGILKDGFEKIAPVVDRIGAAISKYTPAIEKAIAAFGTLKLAAMGANLAGLGGDKKFGAFGLAKAGVTTIAKKLVMSPISGPLAAGEARMATNALGLMAKDGGVVAKMFGSVASSGLIVAAVLAAIAAVIVIAVEMFEHNTMGFRDAIMRVWDTLKDIGSQVWAALSPAVDALKGAVTGILEGVVGTLILNLRALALVVEATTAWMSTNIGKKFLDIAMSNPFSIYKKLSGGSEDAADAAVAKAGDKVTPPNGNPGTNMDFRGSRFEIQQNFAQGFDPNRVAVSFQSQLTKLGEKRLDSGLRPLYSYR